MTPIYKTNSFELSRCAAKNLYRLESIQYDFNYDNLTQSDIALILDATGDSEWFNEECRELMYDDLMDCEIESQRGVPSHSDIFGTGNQAGRAL